jgi:MFS family permease
MTCSVTLIGNYFDGVRRERYLALQTGTAPIAALVFFALGGSLGELNWRYPFVVYAFGLALCPAVGIFLREPNRSDGFYAIRYSEANTGAPLNWSSLMTICALSVFAMSAFMIPIIQLGFLLSQRGIVSSAQIGFWLSTTSLANPVGALMFGLYRSSLVAKLGAAFALMGIGFLIIIMFPSWQALIAAAVVANMGAGMVLPALSFCALQVVQPEKRGMGIGVWTSSIFAGQFLSPLTILGLTVVTGTLTRAVSVYGWLSVLLAAALFAFGARFL